MNRKDLYVVGLLAIVAGLISMMISNSLFGPPKKRFTKVPVVQQISTTFPDVKEDDKYTNFFNNKALNPTEIIRLDQNRNPRPFNNGQ